ncbi:hydroxylaminobenzene mutase [Cecembia rubra]|uniref:Hydroxylaminobenzene mutase n=2 Tax=Cecembia rubra TaxID=1485585 RepID=A0A2P8E1I9_9BACT|nr:hydroxylaminobenzene mutase [Cecembia rubra]
MFHPDNPLIMSISPKVHLQSNRLLFFGSLLFFLGLVVGLFVPILENPRMGLSSHLEGIMNGIFLLVLGIIWPKINLSQRMLNLTFWLTIYGSFANYLVVLIAAATGSGRMMPLAGGKEGPALVEGLVTFMLISLSLAMLTVSVLVLSGLYLRLRHS